MAGYNKLGKEAFAQKKCEDFLFLYTYIIGLQTAESAALIPTIKIAFATITICGNSNIGTRGF
jgi:hypothetical protein